MPNYAQILIADYPLLRAVAWSTDPQSLLTPEEALLMYERGWRHIKHEKMTAHEQELLSHLIATVGGGVPMR